MLRLRSSVVRRPGKEYRYYQLVRAVRVNGKPRQKVVRHIGRLSEEEAEAIRRGLAGVTLRSQWQRSDRFVAVPMAENGRTRWRDVQMPVQDEPCVRAGAVLGRPEPGQGAVRPWAGTSCAYVTIRHQSGPLTRRGRSRQSDEANEGPTVPFRPLCQRGNGTVAQSQLLPS